MRIDPLRLLRLNELIKQGSFRKAADSLCVTQSALSQSITQMESEVGVRLIDRTPHGIVPTIYGKALMHHAAEIEWQLSEAAKKISELTFGQQESLSVGCTAGHIPILTMITCRLREQNRECDVRIIEEAWSRELLSQVEVHAIDAGICSELDDLEMKGKISLPLFQGRRGLCVRANHPQARSLTLRNLARYPFACQGGATGTPPEIKRIFKAYQVDFPSHQLIVSNSLTAAKDLVLNSDAYAIFTDVSVLNETRSGLIKFVGMEEAATAYWHYLIARDDLRVTKLFADFLSTFEIVCQELGVQVNPDIRRIRTGSTLHC
jgi:DNA-binding transcriptional LysR family regulator